MIFELEIEPDINKLDHNVGSLNNALYHLISYKPDFGFVSS